MKPTPQQVDRVAAVCRQVYWGKNHVMTAFGWKETATVVRKRWRKVARAAIKAMGRTKR